MAALTTSVLLLVVFCTHVNSPLPGNTSVRFPAPLFYKADIRKVLKPHIQQRQVSTLLLLAIILAGDVHTNPGPHRQISTYPCGMCERNVSWTDCVACDECSVWYHRSCIEACTDDFSLLKHSSVQWICHKCDSINCGTFTFRSYCLDISNVYQPLSDLSVDSFTSSHHFSPMKTSSPASRHGGNHKHMHSVQSIPTSAPEDADHEHQSTKQYRLPKTAPTHPCHAYRTYSSSIDTADSSSLLQTPKKQNLRLLNVNCGSVIANRAQFLAMIEYTKPDVVCGTESWLGPDHASAEVFPEAYTAYRKDRETLGGGVFILVHKSLISSALPEYDANCEMTWVKIHMQRNSDLILGCFYMAHRNQKDLTELQKSLQKITDGNRCQQVLLAGDFNSPDIDWDMSAVAPGAPDRQLHLDLVDITASALLTQIHQQPTREKNILDLIFTTNPSLVKSSTSVPGISDHHVVVADFDTHPQRVRERPRRHYIYSKAKWEDLKSDIQEIEERINTLKDNKADVNTTWTEFKSSLLSAIEKNIPSILKRSSSCLPWINRTIRKLLRKKKRLYKQAKKSGNWKNYKDHQKDCRREMRKAEWDFVNSTILDGLKEKNSKPFWRYVKSRRKDNIGVAPLKKGPSMYSDALSKASILLDQFCSVFTKDTDDSVPAPELTGQPAPTIADLTVNSNGVLKLLRNINPSKASGPDGIPNKVLKECAESIAPPLTIIFNHSLETGQLPADWLTANISAVFKKGDRNRAENYRPVSLTSVACKLLEHVICHHLRNHLEMFNILTDRNHGFRSGYSCETQLLTTMNDLLESHDAGHQTDVAILDFSKAFDTVPHDRLLQKLDHYGVRGPIHTWLSNFLKHRTMRVVLEGETSEETPVKSGVPQGTVLGPLLFLCHINDLPTSVNSKVRLFADDCLLYREIRSFQDHLTLQSDLQKLELWAKKWGMRFNAQKCYILSTKNTSSYLYSLGGVILQHVQQNTYLGVQISADLKWTTHIGNICRKAGSTLGFLRRNLRNCPKECRRLAFIALVRSRLEYSATVWDPYQKQDVERLEKIQRQAARFITRDYKSRSPGCMSNMLRNLDLPTLEERRKQLRLNLLYRIAGDEIPALPSRQFLTPINTTRRRVRPTKFEGFQTTNLVERHAINHSRGFKVPDSRTEQYRNSFFVRTVMDWNQLSEATITAGSVGAFTSALRKSGPAATPL